MGCLEVEVEVEVEVEEEADRDAEGGADARAEEAENAMIAFTTKAAECKAAEEALARKRRERDSDGHAEKISDARSKFRKLQEAKEKLQAKLTDATDAATAAFDVLKKLLDDDSGVGVLESEVARLKSEKMAAFKTATQLAASAKA